MSRQEGMRGALTSLIIVATLIAIVIRPWRIGEAWFAAAGAVLTVLSGAVNIGSALMAIGSEWKRTLGYTERRRRDLITKKYWERIHDPR